MNLRTTLLHESIFSFYKAFYNYLATKRLYKGGFEHWIEITNYYSKLYLARATTTLLGCQSYSVSANKSYFDKELLEIINPKNYNKFLQGNTRVGYSIELKIDVEKNNGILTLSSKGISTHQDIWSIYKLLQIEELGLTRLDNSDTENWDMIDERNKENYSFDGYMQLDFNLLSSSFPGYFNRDWVVNKSVFIYDEIVGEVLNGFQELYHLYNEFEITNLPIELEKFEHMINYMLDDSIEKEKLLKLCRSGFPLENEFNFEVNNYYDE